MVRLAKMLIGELITSGVQLTPKVAVPPAATAAASAASVQLVMVVEAVSGGVVAFVIDGEAPAVGRGENETTRNTTTVATRSISPIRRPIAFTILSES